jgi:hypothetical protein
MRSFIYALLLVLAATTLASAELLTVANPLGQGKWGVAAAYLMDSNVGNTSGYGMGTIGGYAAYGLTDKLDLYLNLGSANVSGLPAGISAQITAVGLTAKYAVIEESSDMPVSVAIGGGYRSQNYVQSAAIGGNMNGSQIMAGVGVSKVIVPFIPYAGIAYRSTSLAGASTPQYDLTVGSAVAWSTQGAVFFEYTLQSINSTALGNYTSGQIGIDVAYKI